MVTEIFDGLTFELLDGCIATASAGRDGLWNIISETGITTWGVDTEEVIRLKGMKAAAAKTDAIREVKKASSRKSAKDCGPSLTAEEVLVAREARRRKCEEQKARKSALRHAMAEPACTALVALVLARTPDYSFFIEAAPDAIQQAFDWAMRINGKEPCIVPTPGRTGFETRYNGPHYDLPFDTVPEHTGGGIAIGNVPVGISDEGSAQIKFNWRETAEELLRAGLPWRRYKRDHGVAVDKLYGTSNPLFNAEAEA